MLILAISRNSIAIIDYLNESLDIEDWCIVNANELENTTSIFNLTTNKFMTFTTPESFNCFIEHNSMVLFDKVNEGQVIGILDKMSQYQLMNNHWVILAQDTFTKYTILGYERPLSIRTTILIFENNRNEESIFQIIGTATENHKMISLGTPNEINLHEVIKETKMNKNLNGITIAVNYAHLPPFCIVDGNHINGTFFEVLKVLENVLNFTLKIQPPTPGNEHWGKV